MAPLAVMPGLSLRLVLADLSPQKVTAFMQPYSTPRDHIPADLQRQKLARLVYAPNCWGVLLRRIPGA